MTQEKKSFKNVFEAASHLESHRQEEEKKEKISESIDEEVIARGKRMYDEILTGLDHAFRFNQITPSQLRAYVSRPQNFSQQEWKEIQEQKKKNEEMVKNLQSQIQSTREISLLVTQDPKLIEETSRFEKAEKEQQEAFPKTTPQTPPQKKSRSSRMTRRDWLNMH